MQRRHGIRFDDDLINPHLLAAEWVRELPDLGIAGVELLSRYCRWLYDFERRPQTVS